MSGKTVDIETGSRWELSWDCQPITSVIAGILNSSHGDPAIIDIMEIHIFGKVIKRHNLWIKRHFEWYFSQGEIHYLQNAKYYTISKISTHKIMDLNDWNVIKFWRGIPRWSPPLNAYMYLPCLQDTFLLLSGISVKLHTMKYIRLTYVLLSNISNLLIFKSRWTCVRLAWRLVHVVPGHSLYAQSLATVFYYHYRVYIAPPPSFL